MIYEGSNDSMNSTGPLTASRAKALSRIRRLNDEVKGLNCTLKKEGPSEYYLLEKKGNALCLIQWETGPMAGKKCIALAAEFACEAVELEDIEKIIEGIRTRLPSDFPDTYTFNDQSMEDESETWFTPSK